MSQYYDRQGNPISLTRFAELCTDDYRQIDSAKVGDLDVSTVWLGADHSWGHGEPLIFETMVFSNGPLNNEQERYSTEEQAREGHARWVEKCRVALAGQLRPETSEVADAVVRELRSAFGHVPDGVLNAAAAVAIAAVENWQRAVKP